MPRKQKHVGNLNFEQKKKIFGVRRQDAAPAAQSASSGRHCRPTSQTPQTGFLAVGGTGASTQDADVRDSHNGWELWTNIKPSSLNSDFSTPPPPAPVVRTWGELGAVTRSFVAYAQAACDSVTVRVATTLDGFVTELEGWKQFAKDDLPILVWWINKGLEKYRNAVAHDLDTGETTRGAIIERFSISNPESQWLVVAALRLNLRAGVANSDKTPTAMMRRSNREQPERKIPKEVMEHIPTRDNKEVCLHYLTKKGRNSKNPTKCTFRDRLHFWPSKIPSIVQEYIVTSLGGIRERPSQA
ncbi:hypothetical protein PC128_g24152 [Phytophthora cactorum]|nr:hypothetical protein PC120_g13539 [Phytophthora cactorum]KAG3047884.1 hypothetical protein PC121_g19805 [Phytophthora cactorum]KAG3145738.1 hypothetical protein PC128_g24152 [Phytophthora cactorum]